MDRSRTTIALSIEDRIAAKAPRFAMVVPTTRPRGSTLSVEVGGAIIRLESGFDAELLRDVVSALSGQSS